MLDVYFFRIHHAARISVLAFPVHHYERYRCSHYKGFAVAWGPPKQLKDASLNTSHSNSPPSLPVASPTPANDLSITVGHVVLLQ